MPRSSSPLWISEEQQTQIEHWLAAMGTPQQVALRCRIVLAAATGRPETAIAAETSTNRKTVRLWKERFAAQGLPSLWEIAPGRGRKPTYSAAQVQDVIDSTLRSKPKANTHWSCRLMAARSGMSKSTVSNLWRSHNLRPHRTETFKLSRDPKFLEKLTDVVGLYLNPPDKAIVLCVDEKSQIQALNRTQPGLPLKPGRCGTMTHDYKRQRHHHAFRRPRPAAGQGHRRFPPTAPASRIPEVSAPHGSRTSGRENPALGHGQLRYARACRGQSLAQETSPSFCAAWIANFRAGKPCTWSWTTTVRTGMPRSKPGSRNIPKFLRRMDRELPGGKTLHLVMDNYGTHGHAEVKAWLKKHPRFVIHYVPTSCSWLNLVERWFAELTSKWIRRGSFYSVDELIAAIREFLAAWNENPKPFLWTATLDSIVAKLARCRQTLEQIQPGCTAPRSRKRLSS